MTKRSAYGLMLFVPLLLLGTCIGAAEQVDLVFWVNGWPQEALDGIQKAADLFAQQHPDVKSVAVQPISQAQLVEKLTLHVIGDAAPDVVTLPAPFVQYQIKGLIQSIDPFMSKSNVIRRQDYPPMLLQTFAVEGRQYGVPNVEAALGLLLAYNLDIFSQAGLPGSGPTTLEDVYQMHRKITQQDPGTGQLTRVGINPLDSMGLTYFDTIWSAVFDVNWYDTTSRTLKLGAFEPTVEWIKRIYDTPGYTLITGAGIGGWTTGLLSGKLGMQINGSWVPGELKSRQCPWEFGYTWMPSIRSDKATATLPWGTGIPYNAKHPDLSFGLIEFLTTPQAGQIIFDAVGWLNGNLAAMRRLQVRDLPVITKVIGMFDEADRFYAPVALPIMETFRNSAGSALQPVWRNEQPARSALENWQKSMQIQLDETYARAR